MIEVRRSTSASAEAVWAVVADGWTYPTWVVGAARMRAVDAGWPAVGTRLHHSVGPWPLLLDDTTSVLGVEPGRELRLRGRMWPVGEADIHIVIEPRADGGCVLALREDVASGPAGLLPRPVRVALIKPRNEEALRRLAYLAERPSDQAMSAVDLIATRAGTAPVPLVGFVTDEGPFPAPGAAR